VLIAVNRVPRRHRRHAALLVAVVSLAAAVIAAHSAMAGDHLGGAAAICLAVVEVTGAAVILAAPSAPSLPARARRQMGVRKPAGLVPVRVAGAPARAGPAVLQVFRR
jgi:hypothetical protein